MNSERPMKKKTDPRVFEIKGWVKSAGPSWLVKRLLPALAIIFVLDLFYTSLKMMFSIPSQTPAVDSELLRVPPDHPRHLIDFSLNDQSGHIVTKGDLMGKIVVFNFIFTSCSLVCPYVNAQMEKIQSLTASMPKVRLVSVTLDPNDDTVPVLAKYSTNFHADADRWSFLTGNQTLINNLVGTSFLAKDITGEFSSMPGNFANSQRIALVDPKGNIVMYFEGWNNNAADAAVDEIKKLTP